MKRRNEEAEGTAEAASLLCIQLSPDSPTTVPSFTGTHPWASVTFLFSFRPTVLSAVATHWVASPLLVWVSQFFMTCVTNLFPELTSLG